jgi:hypothetical protein
MDDKHDDLDTWLSGRVDPLSPPPGAFDLIRRRARRRKYRKLAVTAGPGEDQLPAGGRDEDSHDEHGLTRTPRGGCRLPAEHHRRPPPQRQCDRTEHGSQRRAAA